jgi:hypothetical protein
MRHPGVRGVNAYVWTAAGQHHIAITSGVEALYGAGIFGNKAAFADYSTLIDHEIGHLWHRDTRLLLAARAVLATTMWLLPVKLLVLFVGGWRFAMADFTRALPRLTEGSEVVRIFTLPAISVSIGLFASYTGVLLALLYLANYAFRRRRELLADRFAASVARDSSEAVEAMERLLKNRPALAPAPSFAGTLNTHPSAAKRLKVFRNPGQQTATAAEVLLIITLFLVLGRALLGDYVFGAAWIESTRTIHILVSILYASALSVLISLPLYDARTDRKRLGASLLQLAGWAVGAALSMIGTDTVLRSFSPPPAEFAAALIDQVERLENSLLAFSLPVTIVVFAALHLVWGRRPSSHTGWALRHITVVASATILLSLLSMAVTPKLVAIRTEYNDRIRAALYDSIYEASGCAAKARAQKEAEKCLARRNEQMARLGIVDTEFANNRFYPPLAWLALWEHPFSRPARWVL